MLVLEFVYLHLPWLCTFFKCSVPVCAYLCLMSVIFARCVLFAVLLVRGGCSTTGLWRDSGYAMYMFLSRNAEVTYCVAAHCQRLILRHVSLQRMLTPTFLVALASWTFGSASGMQLFALMVCSAILCNVHSAHHCRIYSCLSALVCALPLFPARTAVKYSYAHIKVVVKFLSFLVIARDHQVQFT